MGVRVILLGWGGGVWGHCGDFLLDSGTHGSFGDFEVVLGLESYPEWGGGAEKFCEPQGGFCGQAAPSLGDLGEPGCGNAGGAGYRGEGQSQGFDEFFE